MTRWLPIIVLTVVVPLATSTSAKAQADSTAELAKKLQNPIADLISVPLQSNCDFGIGRASAMRYTLNVQPVIPFTLGITRRSRCRQEQKF